MSHPHVLPLRVYFAAFGALLGCTALTTWVAFHDLGPWNTAIALTLAVIKALVVVLYFMHARYASRLVQIFAIAGVYWLLILFAFLMSDYLTRADVPGWESAPGAVRAE